MSGHSKWSQIKRAKGANDVKRGQIFTKLGREITVAAREGGPNPDGNARLRLAMERARGENMPLETVQRAVQRGAGGDGAAQLDEITYEGYGPGGAALLIEATTDNRNRTVAEVRAALSRGGGVLGEAGSVAWNFESRGVVVAEPNGTTDPEDLALQAIDAGAEDYSVQDGALEVLTDPGSVGAVRKALEGAGAKIAAAEVSMVPKTGLDLSPEQAGQVVKLMERLEDLDDVSRVYTNANLPDEVLA